MTIPELVIWAKETKRNIDLKKTRYETKHLPKIEAYLKMLIERGEVISKNTAQISVYMEHIQDGLNKLAERGVKAPPENSTNKPNDNIPKS